MCCLLPDGTKLLPNPKFTYYRGIHLRVIWKEFFVNLIRNMYSQMILLKSSPYLAGVNEIECRNITSPIIYWAQFQYKYRLSRYGYFHYKDKTVSRLSYLYNGNPHTDGMTSLYESSITIETMWRSPTDGTSCRYGGLFSVNAEDLLRVITSLRVTYIDYVMPSGDNKCFVVNRSYIFVDSTASFGKYRRCA